MDKIRLINIFESYGMETIEIHDNIISTNNRAKEICKSGKVSFGVVLTDNQTGGRGRGNRSWEMRAGDGLAISYILGSEKLEKMELGFLAGVGALAVTRTVQKLTSLIPKIKWPNDVLLNRKKFCGVLVEINWVGDEADSGIIGIGINLKESAFPKDLIFSATSLEKEAIKEISNYDLINELTKNLMELISQENISKVIKEWEASLAYKGQKVKIINEKNVLADGILLGLDEKGGVVIEGANKQKNFFYYGDLHLVVKSEDG